MRCLSVCLSRSWILLKRINWSIFKFFSPSGSHTILAFPRQTSCMAILRRGFSNGGVECRWGRQKSILDEYLAIVSMTGEVRTTTATVHRAVYCTDRRDQRMLFITTSMDDHDEEKRTEFNCIRSGKSKAEVRPNRISIDMKHRAASLRQQG